MFAKYVVPLLLIGISGLLLDSHRRSWRAAQRDDRLSERDRRFARSQYLRRTQASSIIGVIGAALGCYPLVPAEPEPMAIYLAALVGACAAIMLLALLDLWATRQNLRRIADEQMAAQYKQAMKMRAANKPSDAES
ncbi:MAG: hypothetical protein WD669_10935 [Pirellulales bacterium]